LILANSHIQLRDKNVANIEIPIDIIMRIVPYFTDTTPAETKIIWVRYGSFFPQSPGVLKANGMGRWAGINNQSASSHLDDNLTKAVNPIQHFELTK
jgi:hypothetical protein